MQTKPLSRVEEYTVSEAFASAIINGEWDGLSKEDAATLDAWLTTQAHEGASFIDGFGELDYKGFTKCDLTNLNSMCYEVRVFFPAK